MSVKPHSTILPTHRHGCRSAQRGVSLLELMVGLTIGLIVSAAAAGSLVYLQATGRTVTEATRMQQDATQAFDLLGRFIRPTRSVGLVPASGDSVTFTPVADYAALDATGIALRADSASLLKVAHPAGPNGVQNDCLGNGSLSVGTLITTFEWRNNQLFCGNNGINPDQVLLDGVAQWVVHYGVRAAAPSRDLQYRTFASDIPWANVESLRVCMVLVSRAPVPEFAEVFRSSAGLTLPDCQGGDMAPAVRADDRLRRSYSHVFAIRPGQ